MSSAIAPSSLKLPTLRKRTAPSTDSVILAGVFGILFFGPLAFGAVEAWSIFVMEASTALLFGLWVWRRTRSSEWDIRDHPLFLPMILFGGLVLVQIVIGLTAYRQATISQALLYLAFAVIVFLVIQSLRRSSQAKTLAVMTSVYGVCLATFSMLQGLSPNGKLYWIRTPRFGGWIYGPYVNHNNYAGLMEMLAPIPLVFCLTRYAHGSVRTVAAAGAALMAGTIFLSGSRAGMIAFTAELILLGLVVIKLQKSIKLASGFWVFAVLMLGLLIWVGGSALSQRVKTIGEETRQEMSGGTRWSIDKDGIHMFAKRPILGWGLGTFSTAYPQFRTFYTHFSVNEAHNDYLQFLVESGLAGFGIILWFLARTLRNGFRKLENWTDDINGAVAVASLLGITGILVHSFVDFNLQVPANAAWFYVLCALAATPYRLESRQRIRRVRSPHSGFSDPDSGNDNPAPRPEA
jgi:O-antigen ligase